MKHFKRALAILLTLVMVLSCVGVASAGLEKTRIDEISAGKPEELKGFKSESFSKNINQYKDEDVVRAIVVLKAAPAADLAQRGSSEEKAVRAKVQAGREEVRKAMSGISYTPVYTFDTLLNGFSCDVAYGDLEKLAAIDGVDAVYVANHYASPVMTAAEDTKMASSNAIFTGIDDVLSEIGADGTGKVIAVLDTGLNVNHEAFADADGNCAKYGRLTKADLAAAVAPGVYVSAKIPFAYDYAEGDADVTDYQGHGTHVSGIATGCTYDAEKDEYTFLGSASGAQLVSMKIFKDEGGGTSDDIYFYALEDAYRLGVDTINMSIGAQNGFTYDASLETEVFGNIYKRLENAGIITCVAGGNEYSMAKYSSAGYIGPEYQDYGVVGSPATYEGNTSVASIENYMYPDYVLTVGGKNYTYTDTCEGDQKWLTVFGDKTTPFVIVRDTTGTNEASDLSLGAPADFAAEGVDVTGKIAVIQRGSLSFEEKVENAAKAGAAGCIVVNNESGILNMSIETFEIPAVCVPQAALSAFEAADPQELTTPLEKEYVQNDSAFLMSDFSSWGASPMLTIDPTVTSVGGRVYSSLPEGNDTYGVYSGTSMATPNFAGTVTTVLQYLDLMGAKNADGSWVSLTKAEQVARAKALLEAAAIILTDEDGYPYSVRKQGAGLANAYNAIKTYATSAFITDPIKELGDDVEKTGHYTFDVTFLNESKYDANYVADAFLLYDYIYNYNKDDPSKAPLYMNTLTEDYLDTDDFDLTCTIAGEEVGLFTVPVGESVTVTVDIKLGDEVKAYFDKMFPNGNYVDGFVSFDDVEVTDEDKLVYYDSGDNAYLMDETGAYAVTYNSDTDTYDVVLNDDGEKTYYEGELSDLELNSYATVHATLLAFYGDWTKGSVLESVDFKDYIEANNFVNTTIAKDDKTYAQLGFTAANVMDPFYTEPNMAYTAVFNSKDEPQKLRYYLGDNLLDYADYYGVHNAFSTEETDADGAYANGVYITPSQLRNCKSLKMTVLDAKTGEVYYVDDTPYLPKGAYDTDKGVWQSSGVFYWTGKDAKGRFVPSGTVAKVVFDATLPYRDTELKEIWSFYVEVDYTAPVIEETVYDAAAKTLTVKASDESYLAGIYLVYDDEAIDAVATSSDKAGEGFTATFDVSKLVEMGIKSLDVCAMDYATNEVSTTAALYEIGKDATITYITPNNTKTVAVKTGDTYVLEDCTEQYEDAQFLLWVDKPVDFANDDTIFGAVTAMYSAGEKIVVEGDMTFYSLYAFGKEKKLDVPNYYYDTANDYSGDWAICGLNYVSGDYDTSDPLALDETGATKSVVADLGGTVGTTYIEFFTDESGIRYTFEKIGKDTYTIKNFKTGKYMAVAGGALAFLDEADETAAWEVVSTEGVNGAVIRSADNAKWILAYNDDEGKFQIFDNTVPIGSFLGLGIYASDYYLNWLYRYSETELEVEGYTTGAKTECKHTSTEVRDAKEPTYTEDGYTGDVWCTVCGKMIQQGVKIDKLICEHTETEVRDAKEPTYTADGYTGDIWCKVCEQLVKKGEVIPATGYPTCYFKSFKDCTAKWYHEAVDYTVANGMMKGVSADQFDPNGQMTRAMVVTVLYRMAGSPAVTATTNFTDVPAGQWYTDAIAWAQDNGIVLGVLADKFAPNDYVTREQIATILWRYENKPESTGDLSSFKDAASVSDYAKTAMAWAVEKGIFSGDNGSLRPTDNATRAEFACIVMRYLGGSYSCETLNAAAPTPAEP